MLKRCNDIYCDISKALFWEAATALPPLTGLQVSPFQARGPCRIPAATLHSIAGGPREICSCHKQMPPRFCSRRADCSETQGKTEGFGFFKTRPSTQTPGPGISNDLGLGVVSTPLAKQLDTVSDPQNVPMFTLNSCDHKSGYHLVPLGM